MIHKIVLFSLFTLSFFTAASIPSQSFAQYDGDTMKVRIKENSTSLFRRDSYTIEFFNNPSVSTKKFTMRLVSYGEVSGCAHLSSAKVDTKTINGTVKINAKDSEIRVNKKAPRYTPYDCEVKHLKSFLDVELDRNELIDNKIKHISLESKKYGEFNTMDVDINRQRIELSNQAGDSTFLTTFWFFPRNSVILHTPSAKIGLNTQDLIREFGEKHGMISMEDRYKGFELPYHASHYVFFSDANRAFFGDKVTEVGQNVKVGEVTAQRTVYTAQGPVEEDYTLDVYASLPGDAQMTRKKR